MPTLPAGLRAALLVASLCAPSLAQKARPQAEPGPRVVGVALPLALEPDLARAGQSAAGLVWGDRLLVPKASFLKAHLVDVNLRAGDVLTLRTGSGALVDTIRGRGPKGEGSFWALSAFGEELLLELSFARPYDEAPFRVDQVLVGDDSIFDPAQSPESICAPEDYDDVICYQSDAGKWQNVMASVGVMSVGGNPATALFCSGSNVSPSNYVLTNAHCLGSQLDCDSTEYVFRYWRQACNTGAPATTNWQGFRCDELVAFSPIGDCDPTLSALDFALTSVIGDPAATFGYVRPDPVRLTDGEAIYIVQHPDGRPHEIAHGSGPDVDVAGTTLRYYDTLDTEGGSSGSPIFRESDDRMVALHHCGGCETLGVGNRGMLMADIYPLIADFLCTTAVEVQAQASAAPVEVLGNGDAVMDPGETWSFVPAVRNLACSDVAYDVRARVRVNPASTASVHLLQRAVAFGDVGPSSSAGASPVRFQIARGSPCGATVVLDLVEVESMGVGLFPDAPAVVSHSVGLEPFATVFLDDFSGGGGAWTIVNGGTGSGPASTWTTTNPGGRSLGLVAPMFIADSDELGTGLSMDEELVSPAVDCTGQASVRLQYRHDFHWYSGGQNEKGDVQVRSSLTGGAWTTVAGYAGADASGVVTLDVSAQAAGAADVQVRFHYYDAVYEWWWAVDEVYLLGSQGFVCDVFDVGLRGGKQPR